MWDLPPPHGDGEHMAPAVDLAVISNVFIQKATFDPSRGVREMCVCP